VIVLDVWELDGQPLRGDVGSRFRSCFATGPVLVWIGGSLLVAAENGKLGVVGDFA
jgi:hypothetical protein